MKKERLAYIDNIKCFAIVLVVLGHLIQYIYYPNTFDHNHVFRYIYSFHMPLFMAISGFIVGLSSQNKKINLLESILKRAKQLLIPFISWAIVSTIIGKNINKFFSIIKNPDNGLWFLWVLFFIYLAYLITLSLKNLFNLKFIQFKIYSSEYICSLIIFIILYLLSSSIHGILGSSLITKYYFYYMLGYFLAFKNIINTIPQKKYSIITVICILSFIILGYFWERTGLIFTPFEEIKFNKLINIPYNIITALVGIVGTILIFKSIKITSKITLYIGKRTLAIYAIHFLIIDLLKIIPIHNIYTIIITLPITIISSLLLEYLLSINKYTSLLFLGKTK